MLVLVLHHTSICFTCYLNSDIEAAASDMGGDRIRYRRCASDIGGDRIRYRRCASDIELWCGCGRIRRRKRWCIDVDIHNNFPNFTQKQCIKSASWGINFRKNMFFKCMGLVAMSHEYAPRCPDGPGEGRVKRPKGLPRSFQTPSEDP